MVGSSLLQSMRWPSWVKRQFAVEQQVGDFLEDRRRRQVADVVATVGQAGAFLADGGQGCLAGHLATQAGATQYFCFSHCSLLS